MCAFAAQVVTDLGGEGELSALERAYVAKLRDLEVTQRLLMADIAHRGLVTPAGGVRRPFAAFLSAIDRFGRLIPEDREHLGRRTLEGAMDGATQETGSILANGRTRMTATAALRTGGRLTVPSAV